MNPIRSLLLGSVAPLCPRVGPGWQPPSSTLLDGAQPVLAPHIHALMKVMREQWRALDEWIKGFDAEFVAAARNEPSAQRLLTVPGIGALNETALVAVFPEGL